jgi:hypothetical protein
VTIKRVDPSREGSARARSGAAAGGWSGPERLLAVRSGPERLLAAAGGPERLLAVRSGPERLLAVRSGPERLLAGGAAAGGWSGCWRVVAQPKQSEHSEIFRFSVCLSRCAG